MLDFSKIEAGELKIDRRPVDLTHVVETTSRLFQGAASAKKLYLRCYVAPSIRAPMLLDPVRLQQILANLLSNAIKFTAEGGVVVTTMRHGDPDDQRPTIEITVSDSGIGISDTAQLQLFQPFTQADESIARRFGGTGLGLSISRRLTRLMDGTLTLESRQGRGTTVRLALPAVETALPATEDGLDLKGLRVGLVARDPVESENLTAYLTYWGVEVVPVAPGPTVLDPIAVVLGPLAWAEGIRAAVPSCGPAATRFVFLTDETFRSTACAR